MSVGDCQNLDRCLLFPIENSEWEASQDELSCKVDRCGSVPLEVPTERQLQLFES